MASTQDVLDRLADKFTVGDGCWEWTAARTHGGYGRFHLGSRRDGSRTTVLAHRIIYELMGGRIRHGLDVDHLCRNRGCVRPDHLEPVTRAENIRRGDTGALNRGKTHCPAGHLYDDRNTYVDGCGYRHCRACGLAGYYRRKGG